MLVLSRQVGQSIVIGSGDTAITVCVIDIRTDKVRIGVDCARAIPVHRLEVYRAIQRSGGDLVTRAGGES